MKIAVWAEALKVRCDSTALSPGIYHPAISPMAESQATALPMPATLNVAYNPSVHAASTMGTVNAAASGSPRP